MKRGQLQLDGKATAAQQHAVSPLTKQHGQINSGSADNRQVHSTALAKDTGSSCSPEKPQFPGLSPSEELRAMQERVKELEAIVQRQNMLIPVKTSNTGEKAASDSDGAVQQPPMESRSSSRTTPGSSLAKTKRDPSQRNSLPVRQVRPLEEDLFGEKVSSDDDDDDDRPLSVDRKSPSVAKKRPSQSQSSSSRFHPKKKAEHHNDSGSDWDDLDGEGYF